MSQEQAPKDPTESSIPVTPEVVLSVISGFALKPVNGIDSYEQMSIGVATDSIVATDGHSAIIIGENAGRHVATQRKEVVIEATRASQYGDIFRIDDVAKNLSAAGEELQMPDVERVVRTGLAGMKHLASINPKALASICKVAIAGGVKSVDFFQPEGQPDKLGFEFSIYPEERHTSLFRSWDGPIKVRGVFVVSKSDFQADTDRETPGEVPGEDSPQTEEPKRGRRKKEQAILSQALIEQISGGVTIEWADTEIQRPLGSWAGPSLNLLAPIDDTVAEPGGYDRMIAETLRSFNLAGRVVAIHTGPTITQYEIEVPPGTNVAKYLKLSDDLQVQLGVQSVLINLLPGKKTLGIEIPNVTPRMVRLSEVCGTKSFIDSSSPLLVALGLGTDGVAIYTDLTAAPHLLVGGATNSGKSIGIATIICSLILRNSPETVRLVLIDPKKVEFPLFEGLPHLMCPVITDMKEVSGVLRAVVREMDRRYDTLQEAKARNIGSYNAIEGVEKLPYVVVVIDELADMMLQIGAEVETSICRLTQLARAVGIHLIIGTQRPSVDVITGVIKANVPSRISFFVSTGVDSKVILDSTGAEKLLGRGDMLFSAVGSAKPSRIQGAYTSEQEIAALCQHWRAQRKPEYELVVGENSAPPEVEGDIDPLYDEAVEWVIERGQASTSMLQRKYSIGFQRASRLLDLMEENKVVGPRDGPRPREVLAVKGSPEMEFAYQCEKAYEHIRGMKRIAASTIQKEVGVGFLTAVRILDHFEAKGIVGPSEGSTLPRDVYPHKEIILSATFTVEEGDSVEVLIRGNGARLGALFTGPVSDRGFLREEVAKKTLGDTPDDWAFKRAQELVTSYRAAK